MNKTPDPSSNRTWKNADGDFSLDSAARSVEVLVQGHGWCVAHALYTLSHFTNANFFSWRVLELDTQNSRLSPPDAVLVVEFESQLHDTGFGEVDEYTNITTWFVPKSLIDAPERLVNCGRGALDRFLLRDSVKHTSATPALSLVEVAAMELPNVPVDSIQPAIQAIIVKAASQIADHAGLTIQAQPCAAAYRYEEYESDSNSNDVVECRWVWRLGFVTDNNGILTIQAQDSDVDTSEKSGPTSMSPRLCAWFTHPGNPECVTWECPGVPFLVQIGNNNDLTES